MNKTTEYIFKTIETHWKEVDAIIKPSCYVIGISGGIDSTCVAALACKIFGKNRVVGVSLPCDGQKDMDDVNSAFAWLGIRRLTIDIGDAFNSLLTKCENNCLEITDVCKTNMPARLRMTTLYAVAQCINGFVVNTSNRSESILGNDTLFGDNCGSYAPVQRLVKTEIRNLAEYLGVPSLLVKKIPIDGLQPLSDEERLGVSYDDVDAFIRRWREIPENIVKIILSKYRANRFKIKMVKIDGPIFSLHDEIDKLEFAGDI